MECLLSGVKRTFQTQAKCLLVTDIGICLVEAIAFYWIRSATTLSCGDTTTILFWVTKNLYVFT